MSERDEIRAEFEALGEAEVGDRLARHTYDNLHQVYALQWLNDLGVARMLASRREGAAGSVKRNRLSRAAIVDAALVVAGVLGGLALAAVVFIVPAIVTYGSVEKFWLRAQVVMRQMQAAAMQVMHMMG